MKLFVMTIIGFLLMLAFAAVKYLILTKKNVRFLDYGKKYSKKKNDIYICVNRKELDKIYKELVVCQKKLVSTRDVKTILFVTDLSLFINNRCTTLTMKKAKCYGKFT